MVIFFHRYVSVTFQRMKEKRIRVCVKIKPWTTNCSSCSDKSSIHSKPSRSFDYQSEMLSNWSKKCSNYFELLHTVSGKEYIILIRPIYFFCRLGFIARNFRFRWIQSPVIDYIPSLHSLSCDNA